MIVARFPVDNRAGTTHLMSKIVGVHGIGQQFKGPEVLRTEWYPALCDGMTLAGASAPSGEDLQCAFYGDLFRDLQVALQATPGLKGQIASEPSFELDAEELEYVRAFAEAARERAGGAPEIEEVVVRKGAVAFVASGASRFLNPALRWLTSRPWLGSTLPAVVLTDLKQVRAYLCDKPKGIRAEACARVKETIRREKPRVVVAHSLGSVVAWEALCSLGDSGVHTFITIGSPLGIKALVHSRLLPAPAHGRAAWPGGVQRWVNLAEKGDIVATEPKLQGLFNSSPANMAVVDLPISNGWSDPHSALHYLTAAHTGQAIAEGLST